MELWIKKTITSLQLEIINKLKISIIFNGIILFVLQKNINNLIVFIIQKIMEYNFLLLQKQQLLDLNHGFFVK